MDVFSSAMMMTKKPPIILCHHTRHIHVTYIHSVYVNEFAYLTVRKPLGSCILITRDNYKKGFANFIIILVMTTHTKNTQYVYDALL